MADEILAPPPPVAQAPEVAPTAPIVDPQASSAAVPTAPDAQQDDSASHIKLYDISGGQPVLGSIAHDEVTDAVASGKFTFPKGAPIHVMSPDGEMGTIDPSEAPEAFQNGYKYATPKDVMHHQYAQEPAKAALEGIAKGALGPLATGAERIFGVDPEAIRGREEANPLAHGLGEAAGFVGSLVSGTGIAPIVEAGGKALAKGIEGVGLLSDAARGATRIGAEMAMLQGGDEVSKLITNDPRQSVGTALTDIGLASALGGLMGGVGSGIISPLWKATVGDKAGQFVADLQGRMKYHMENPDLHGAIEKELGDQYGFIKGIADDVYGPTGLKAQEIEKLVPEMSPKILEHTNTVSDDLTSQVKKMINKPNSYPERLSSKLQDDLNVFREKVSAPDVSSHDVFNATQDLKQTLQGYAKYDKFVKPVDDAYDFVRDAKNMASKLRESLEDSKVWGQAAERQQAINKAFVQFKPALEDFESKFTSEIANPEGGYKRIVDPGKVQTLLNQTDKPAGELKRKMLQNFLDASDKYKDVISKTHANLGLESPMAPTSLHATQGIMGKLTPGASVADWYVKKGMHEMAANAASTTIGGAVGHATGIPGAGTLGTLIGQQTLGPAFKSIFPALLKPLVHLDVNPAGFKAAMDYGMSVVKGQELISKATQNVFKIGKDAVPESAMPTEKDRMKLDKLLKAAQTNPGALLNGPGASQAHYLPDHGTNLSETAANAVNLLNQQRPSEAKLSPLDSKPVVDKAHQAAFNRTLDIAQQPLVVLDHIKKGTLLPSDVATMQRLYPGLYEKVSQQLTNEMINHMSKGDGQAVPYRTRMSLSMFLAQPMDSTMKPSSIMAAQPQNQGQGPQMQAQGPGQPRAAPAKLNNIASSYETKSQAREADRQKKS